MAYLYYRFAPKPADIPAAPATQAILPNNSAISVANFSGTVEQTSTRLRLTRPFNTGDVYPGGDGLRHAAPGALARFGCTLNEYSQVNVTVAMTGLVVRPDFNNAVGSIFANGLYVTDFQTSGTVSFNLPAGIYNIEVMFPYAASMDVTGVAIPASGSFQPASAAPAEVGLFLGDSIINDFFASRARLSWVTLLSQAKGWQQINWGYGGQPIQPTWFTTAGAVPGKRTITNFGINDCFAGTSPSAIQTAVQTSITNHRSAATSAGNPTKKLEWINLFDCTNPGLITAPSAARTAIAAAFTAVGGPYDILIPGGTANGLPPMTGANTTDLTHFSDLGSQLAAAALTPQVS